jgi:glutaredoxin
MNKDKLTVLTLPTCSHCKELIEELSRRGITPIVVDLSLASNRTPEIFTHLRDSHSMTTPVVIRETPTGVQYYSRDEGTLSTLMDSLGV